MLDVWEHFPADSMRCRLGGLGRAGEAVYFRATEWREKLLAWHLTTVSMNKTHSTFETKPFKSESAHWCTKTQDHRPVPLLAVKQEAFKSPSFYWDLSLRRNGATARLPFHCGTCNPQRLWLLKSFLSYLHMSVKERLRTGAAYKWQAPFQVPTGGEFRGDWENDCPSPN